MGNKSKLMSKIIITAPTPNVVESDETKIITSEQIQEVKDTVEFELIENSQEVTPTAEPVAEPTPTEPAEVETLDNSAMLNFMKEMKEQQAKQAEEFNLKFAEQQAQIELLAQEKEVLKAQTVKTIDTEVMRETLEKIKDKEQARTTDLRQLGILKNAIENIDGVSVNIMRNGTDLLTRVTLTDAVIETLKNCLNRTESHIKKLDAQIQNLKTF